MARKPSSEGQELCESGGRLAVLLLTENWDACSGAGRDLFRAIQVLRSQLVCVLIMHTWSFA